jgi:hypothetical protein
MIEALLERPEPAQERALEMISVVRRGLEGSVDPSRRALREGDALVMPQRCYEVSGSIEPDVAIDNVLGAHADNVGPVRL